MEIVPWLEDKKIIFQKYLNDVRKSKLKMLNPKVQGQVMASAGCIAFIDDMLKRIKQGEIKL